MRIPHNEPLGSGSLEAHPAGNDQPERRCILTGSHGSRDELIRLAISPDGDVLPDVMARAPGRGAWIGAQAAQHIEAVDARQFQVEQHQLRVGGARSGIGFAMHQRDRGS